MGAPIPLTDGDRQGEGWAAATAAEAGRGQCIDKAKKWGCLDGSDPVIPYTFEAIGVFLFVEVGHFGHVRVSGRGDFFGWVFWRGVWVWRGIGVRRGVGQGVAVLVLVDRGGGCGGVDRVVVVCDVRVVRGGAGGVVCVGGGDGGG